MMNFSAMKERKKLRLEILEQLYNLHFHSPTQNQCLVGSTKELFGERNSEKHLAFHYLLLSEYIEIDNNDDDQTIVTITTKGIDYVENIYEENIK